MNKACHLNAENSHIAGMFGVDELLERLRELVVNICSYASRVGEDVAFDLIDDAVAGIAAEAYRDTQIFVQVKNYCAKHIVPVIVESNLGRLIIGEGLNNAKGNYRVMENIWASSRSRAEKYAGVTHRGELLNAYKCRSDNAKANVARIEWFASFLSAYAHADIAALGSGSAIEIRLLLAGRDNGNTFYIFDQCADACHQASQIIQPHHASRVEPVFGNPVIGFLKSKTQYDLVYSLGMLDYFGGDQSVALVRKLFSRVKPGGRLVLGNARPESRARFWLELVGEWNLIYKSDAEMYGLGEKACAGCRCQVLTDSFGVYNFLVINKE